MVVPSLGQQARQGGGQGRLLDHALFAVVTQELNLPTGRQLHFWLAGGDLNELIKIEQDVEHAAKARGIRRISIIGRRGWQRKLDGFNEAGVVLTKDI